MASKHEFRWHRIPPVQFVLYCGLRAILMAITMFPYSAAGRIGRFLGGLMMRVDRRHRTVASLNLQRSGITDDVGGMVRRVYDHFGRSLVEFGMTPKLVSQGTVLRYVRLLGDKQAAESAFPRGKGMIVVIAHLGNWELAGLAVQLTGYKLHSLARPIENPYINGWLLRSRTFTGQTIIPKHGALQAMVEVLKRNEILVVQTDQDARRSGVMVDFFGRPASTVRSPAILSLKYGSPIVPANIYREGEMHYFVVTEPIWPEEFRGRPDAVKDLTQAYTRRLEDFVRAHPDQWNWLHRRWKSYDRMQFVEEKGVEANV